MNHLSSQKRVNWISEINDSFQGSFVINLTIICTAGGKEGKKKKKKDGPNFFGVRLILYSGLWQNIYNLFDINWLNKLGNESEEIIELNRLKRFKSWLNYSTELLWLESRDSVQLNDSLRFIQLICALPVRALLIQLIKSVPVDVFTKRKKKKGCWRCGTQIVLNSLGFCELFYSVCAENTKPSSPESCSVCVCVSQIKTDRGSGQNLCWVTWLIQAILKDFKSVHACVEVRGSRHCEMLL